MKKGIVRKIVTVLYERLQKSRLAVFLFPVQVKRDLKVLGKEETAFYVQKLTQILGVLIVLLFVVFFGVKEAYDSRRLQVKTVERPTADAKSEEVRLRIEKGEVYTFEISPRILTEAEAKQAFSEFLLKLEDYILGDNRNLMSVTEALLLPDALSGYPFTIYWESEKEHIVDNVGNVYRTHLEQDELVRLTAICTYMEYQWETEFSVQVLKEELSEAEQYKRALSNYLVENEKNNRNEAIWELPDHFEGEHLRYHAVMKWDKFLILGVLICVTAVLLWIGNDKDLRNVRKKRQDILEEDYLNFVSGLSLYILAGLNLQTAMKYCVRDYEKKKPAGDLLQKALLDFEKDISNGYSFQTALDMFADRADHRYYKRLAGLLQQGLINGTGDLAQMIRQEVDKIREDKRRQSKIKGEKMSSALIAPMLLQLCMVMAFIMIPAFSNMQF